MTMMKWKSQLAQLDSLNKLLNNNNVEPKEKLLSQVFTIGSILNFTRNSGFLSFKIGGENIEITSGSPLPGMKPQQLEEIIMIPKETIDILKDQVFGFDSFFVTS